jgi:catechol 2,3-dioxygenase-like lactoylglutathione lyase family enzyme
VVRVLQPEDLYHVGIVVADVPAAMERWTLLGGYRWMPVVEHPVRVWTPSGIQSVALQMVYSDGSPRGAGSEPPRLELIRAVPGTVWAAPRSGAIHHVGWFVDDVPAASNELARAGCPVEACGCDPDDRPRGFAYHRDADGALIELASRTVMRDLEQLVTRTSSDRVAAGAASGEEQVP